MARKYDDRRPHRESHRGRLNRIVAILVIAVVTLCALSSWEDKHGAGLMPTLELPQLGFLREFIDDFTTRDSGAGEAVQVSGGLPDATLLVHFQNVGQASSILIEGPEKTLLIDAAEDSEGDDVLRYIRAQGVDRLDYVIATHPHADHIGGLDEVLLALPAGEIILPEIPEEIIPPTQVYDDLLGAIDTMDIDRTEAAPGRSIDLGDGAVLTILAPLGEYEDLNNMSVVCRLVYGETSFLFTSDASEGAEGDILLGGNPIRADVLSVGHHGSETSTGEGFLNTVSPRIAVISCGIDNSFGHPHRAVIERLQSHDIRIFRTDLDGVVVVSSNGERLNTQSEKGQLTMDN